MLTWCRIFCDVESHAVFRVCALVTGGITKTTEIKFHFWIFRTKVFSFRHGAQDMVC